MTKPAASPVAALTPPCEPIRLVVGQISLMFDDGGLRHLKLGRREVIRRIYGAVRDRNWGTVPGTISNLRTETGGAGFRITYTSTHRENEIHFVWQAEITGQADGTIAFTLDGEAKSTFLRNRIGLCVLHPIACAGARCRVERADGSRAELTFPELVEAAQPVPGIYDLQALAHEPAPGVWAQLRFEGDLFEMEDQRNWIDASYKIFSTPLRIPHPVEIQAGTRVRQAVRLLWEGLEALPPDEPGQPSGEPHRPSRALAGFEPSLSGSPESDAVEVLLTTDRHPLPGVGVGMAWHGQPLTPREIAMLSELWLWHLRVDVRLATAAWPEQVRLAHQQSLDLGVALELAVHLPRAGGEAALEELARRLYALRSEAARALVFRDGEKTVSARSYHLARSHLDFLGVPIGAGTDADFHELNRARPPHAEADFVHWSMNPQVHAFDLASLRETPSAIPSQLHSARAYFPDKPLVVSPITLRPRFNPAATGPEPPVPPGALPPQVDARQLTPFGAVWTLAVLKHLAESGAESVTLFETTGWRGVMEREDGSLLPDRFPSQPGQVFPLYHAIGEVTGFGGGEVIVTRSGDPLRIESLALARKGCACVYLANMTGEPQTARLSGFRQATHSHFLDWSQETAWKFEPRALLRKTGPELSPAREDRIAVAIAPFGLARLELKL